MPRSPRHDAIIYDCEIRALIPDTKPRLDGYFYCKGWTDYIGMGISVICCYDLAEQMPRIFMADNLDDFQALVRSREYVIGFNSLRFDDLLCQAHGIDIKTTFDLYREFKVAAGLSADARVGGYKLKQICEKNLHINKSGEGQSAPMLWQKKKIGELIDYCMRDVMLTWKIISKSLSEKPLLCPVNNIEIQPLRSFFVGKHGSEQVRMNLGVPDEQLRATTKRLTK